jgi:DNA primase
VKDTSRLLEMEESVLWSELNKLMIREQRSQRNPDRDEAPLPDYSREPVTEEQPAAHEELIALHEREFIRLLIKFGSHPDDEQQPMHEMARQELEDVEFITPLYREIFSMYTARVQAGEAVDADYFIRNGSEEIKKAVVDLISDRHEVSSLWFERFKIYVPSEEDLVGRMFFTNMARLKRSIIQKLIDEHKEKLKNASDPDEIDELLHIQQELKRTEKQLADVLGIVISK